MQARTEIEIAAPTEQTRHIVLLIAPTIFLSAFLLFCSEPMVGKMMLPLFGGSGAGWNNRPFFFSLVPVGRLLFRPVPGNFAKVNRTAAAEAVLMVLGGASVVWKHLGEGETLTRRDLGTAALPPRERVYWLAAAFVPSALMLAVTNHLLLNLASAPFLWVMSLATYLITFMIAFGRRFRLSHVTLSRIVPVILLVLFPFVAASKSVSADRLWYVLGSHLFLLFGGALLCHTALASRRPRSEERRVGKEGRG